MLSVITLATGAPGLPAGLWGSDRAWAQVAVGNPSEQLPGVGHAGMQPGGALSVPDGVGSLRPVDLRTQGLFYTYEPSGRRDPFGALIQQHGSKKKDKKLPPLLRVGLPELSLIGIIWGGFGYTAMVETPDGKGYAVRKGTRIGGNHGVVSQISEKGLVVSERFTDVYGKEQEREHVKFLHMSEETE